MRVGLGLVAVFAVLACAPRGPVVVPDAIPDSNVRALDARRAVHDVASRGQTVRLLLERVPDAAGTLVLFAGGKGAMAIDGATGALGWGRGNFLIRSRWLFQDQGFNTVVIDAPSDRSRALHHFRHTAAHATDIAAVVRHLRAEVGPNVWLVGTSRGTISVVNAGVRLAAAEHGKPDGLVLTASLMMPNRNGSHVLAMDLDAIDLPVFIGHHARDPCRATPPGRAADLEARMTNAQAVVRKSYAGGGPARGNPCQARTAHGFVGIEDRVVADIASWIKGR